MGKLFGTDGYRGIVNDNLGVDIATKIGASVAQVLKKEKEKKDLNFLIGSDTRKSKDMLISAISAGFLSEGCNIIDVGIIPSPGVSYLVEKYQADGAFIITASHNPSEYNGIKVIVENGFKMTESLEEKIENVLLNNFSFSKEINNVGTYSKKEEAIDDYVDHLVQMFPIDLSKINFVIDTANGASYLVAQKLFTKLKANFTLINNTPDGLNINRSAGSTSLDGLKKKVLEEKFDLGIAYDGDADRCLLVDELGNTITGDCILAIVAKDLVQKNKLKNNTIVGTVMSNMGLSKFCEEYNINFVATKVGDKYVLEELLKNDYILGGEESGHIIFKEYANTGDGLLTSLQILKIISESKQKLSVLSQVMTNYPQVLINVKVSKDKKDSYSKNQNITNKIKEYEEKLAGNGRILIRPSGTENLIRVMMEGSNLKMIEQYTQELALYIKEELN